jgi:haloalkane dehalogenase
MEAIEAPLTRGARRGRLPADVWPFDTNVLDVEGSEVAVTDVGRGPTLLFYTGIGSFIWRDVIVRLSGAFRCVAADPPASA